MYGKWFSRSQTSNHKWQWSEGTDKKQNTWALQLLWELDNKKGWVPKNWCLQIVVLEKTPESPLGSKAVNLKGYQPWIFTGRTDAEVEASVLWPPDTKNWLIRKDSDAGKDWRQEEKGMPEDEMDGIMDSMDMSLSKLWEMVKDKEAGILQFMGHKESDTTEWLNNKTFICFQFSCSVVRLFATPWTSAR